MGYSFRLAARWVFLDALSHRQDNTFYGFVAPVVEYWLDEIVQRADALSRSYILLHTEEDVAAIHMFYVFVLFFGIYI